MEKSKAVVALCMPIGGFHLKPQFFDSWCKLRREFLAGWYHFRKVGLPIDVARNMLTVEALDAHIVAQRSGYKDAPKVTHLMWIDDDMVYTPDLLERLLARDLDFVGGLCHDRRHPFKPVIEREISTEWGVDPGTYGWMFDFPRNQLVDVDATGGACILVKREVFEKVRVDDCRKRCALATDSPGYEKQLAKHVEDYTDWWTPANNEGHSEDLSFCRRARASGFKLAVDTSLDIGHVGEVVIDIDFAQRNRQFEYSQTMPAGQVLSEAQACTGRPDEYPDEGMPVASIVIPTYNAKPEYLRAAVASALAQTVPVEVIVVDDGSDVPVDASLFAGVANTAKVWRILRHEQNQGISAALNTGIAAMTTRWFCWLSADDWLQPTKVEYQMSALLCAGKLAGYHGYNLRLDRGNHIGHIGTVIWVNKEDQQKLLATGCHINGSTVMIHKSVFDKVGLFDTSFKYSQDWAMWNCVAREYLWHGMPDKLATRRAFGNLTERIDAADPEDKDRQRRDAEDNRVRRMFAVRVCTHCGEPLE